MCVFLLKSGGSIDAGRYFFEVERVQEVLFCGAEGNFL